MHSFEWVESALGVIIALSMTRLVLSIANMFIARRQVRLDWVPFVWSVTIFLLLLELSWNFVHLGAQVKVWNFSMFLMLLVLVFNLFFAAVLILPNTEAQSGGDLRDWYDLNGRWSTLFIAFYTLLTEPFYWRFLNVSPIQNFAAIVIICFSIVAFFAKSRPVLLSATILVSLSVGELVVQMALRNQL